MSLREIELATRGTFNSMAACHCSRREVDESNVRFIDRSSINDIVDNRGAQLRPRQRDMSAIAHA